jgi:hypothetical protein
MNEGGWNLVDHSSAQASETNSNSDGSPEKEFTVPVKQASFAWRGGQERQTTGEHNGCFCTIGLLADLCTASGVQASGCGLSRSSAPPARRAGRSWRCF